MSRHLADRQSPTTASRLIHFLRVARGPHPGWHRSEATGAQTRVVQFVRIARGRTV